MNTIEVLLPVSGLGDKLFSYHVNKNIHYDIGSYVKVEFGKRVLIGIVWAINNESNINYKIKEIIEKIQLPPLCENMRKFIIFVGFYYFIPLSKLINKVYKDEYITSVNYYKFNYQVYEKNTKNKRLNNWLEKLHNVFESEDIMSDIKLKSKIIISRDSLQFLIDKNVLTLQNKANSKNISEELPQRVILSVQQGKIANQILEYKKNFSVHYVEGNTGSGKTEIYIYYIIEMLNNFKSGQVLVLLPEIMLVSQILQRLQKYIDIEIFQWHSDTSEKQKKYNWLKVIDGDIRIIIGTRSAIFLPFKNLKAIIIDEEHDKSYKEDCSYNGRDVAIGRGKYFSIPVLLFTATPSLETLNNAQIGRYHYYLLLERYYKVTMPKIEIINMRGVKDGWISPILLKKIEDNIVKNEQSLLFLNRRGYSPMIICSHCGHKKKCINCSAWLTNHNNKMLLCHYCGYSKAYPQSCDNCSSENSFIACGPGVERILEEIEKKIQNVKILIISSDIITTATKQKEAIAKILNNEVDIIIGTQIITKGYHIPNLTLVGIVDADAGLNGCDIRSSEHTYQLLYQVAGRAGREKEGAVMVQTYIPDSSLLKSLINYDKVSFYKLLLKEREENKMPPFGRLYTIIITGYNDKEVKLYAINFLRYKPKEIQSLGPAQGLIHPLRNRYSYRFLLIMGKNNNQNHHLINLWIKHVDINKKHIKVKLDVDPLVFL